MPSPCPAVPGGPTTTEGTDESEASVLATLEAPYTGYPSTAPTWFAPSSPTDALPVLERVLQLLLTPFDSPDVRTWLEKARAAVRQLTGIDAQLELSVADAESWELLEKAYDVYLVGGDAGNSIDAGTGLQRSTLIRMVVPAYRSGVSAWRQLEARRNTIAALVDALPEAVMIYDASGNLVHANPRALELVRNDARRDAAARVQAEAQRIAWTVSATARRASSRSAGGAATRDASVREVRAGANVFRLRGTFAPAGTLGAEPSVFVTAAFETVNPLTDDELRAQFGLSAREIEVARLVAAGLSNQEIAEKIGVSFFTARNHVERMLAKLGVGSRARVGPVLRNEAA